MLQRHFSQWSTGFEPMKLVLLIATFVEVNFPPEKKIFLRHKKENFAESDIYSVTLRFLVKVFDTITSTYTQFQENLYVLFTPM